MISLIGSWFSNRFPRILVVRACLVWQVRETFHCVEGTILKSARYLTPSIILVRVNSSGQPIDTAARCTRMKARGGIVMDD